MLQEDRRSMARRVAGMHEERDRAILAVQRLAEAEGAVMHHVGFNPRKVGSARHPAF